MGAKLINSIIKSATESSSRFDSIKPDQYYIVKDYFKQYALGVTGTRRSNTIYTRNSSGDGFGTKREAASAADSVGIKRLRKKGKDTPYGELGAETVDVSIVIGKQIIGAYQHYDVRVLPNSATESVSPNKYSTKLLVGDKVRVIHDGGRLSQEVASITGHDEDGFYTVRWSDGDVSKGLSDAQLRKVVDDSDDD